MVCIVTPAHRKHGAGKFMWGEGCMFEGDPAIVLV